MSRFGWAYVNSSITGAVANGPTNSVQFNSGSQVLSGSSNFTFDPSTNKVTLLGQLTGSTLVISASVVSASTYLGITGGGSTSPGGTDQTIQFNSGSTFAGSNNLKFDYSTNTLHLTGTLRADNLIVSSSQILKSGSTIFGDDISDTHQFTGSILGGIVSGTIARFIAVTGSTVTGSDAKFTTITGSNIQTNGISLTGALLMSGTAYISEVDYIDFDVSASIPAYKAARIFHDTNTNDLSYYLPLANQALQIGQQTVVKVKNSSGSPIAKGKLVHITGGVGDNPLINTASWENDDNSANTLGMLMSTVADGGFGYALLNGVMSGVNTDPATYSEGQVVYLSSSGDYTNVTPVAPKHTVRLGQVIRAHATVGSIFIKIDNGYEIDELHNILITSASTGDILTYNSSSALWTNSKSLSGSYTITGSLTATNTISASTGQFTTITGSTVTGSTALFTEITGNLFGTASFATNANNATTVTNGVYTNANNTFTGINTFNTNYITGSITGSDAKFTTLTASSISANRIPAFDGDQTLQFNSGSSLSGSTNLKYNYVTNNLYLTGNIDINGDIDVLGNNTTTIGAGSNIFLIQNDTPNDLFKISKNGSESITIGNNSGETDIIVTINGLIDSRFQINVPTSGTTAQFTNITASIVTSSGDIRAAGSILSSQAIKGGYATYSGSFTVPSTSYFIGISTTGSVVTASLSNATTYPAGQTLYFKDIGGNAGTNNIRIQPSGSQTIDGATGGVIIASNSGSITLVSNGTDQFYIVGMV